MKLEELSQTQIWLHVFFFLLCEEQCFTLLLTLSLLDRTKREGEKKHGSTPLHSNLYQNQWIKLNINLYHICLQTLHYIKQCLNANPSCFQHIKCWLMIKHLSWILTELQESNKNVCRLILLYNKSKLFFFFF